MRFTSSRSRVSLISETKQLFLSRGSLFLATVVTLGIALLSTTQRLPSKVGYNDLGMVIFTLSYADMVVTIWYGWIRPPDITGPAE